MKIEIDNPEYKLTLEYDQNSGITLWKMLVDFERTIIGKTLDLFPGNKAKAAIHLKLNRTTFFMKAKKYGFPYKSKKAYTE